MRWPCDADSNSQDFIDISVKHCVCGGLMRRKSKARQFLGNSPGKPQDVCIVGAPLRHKVYTQQNQNPG